jgi:hypothetical protein
VVFNNGTNVVDAINYISSISFAAPLSVATGGTGATTLTANNVILGNGTSTVQVVAPGSSGNVLVSNGTTWVSAIPAGFPSGTRMTFNQTAAPTGWTKSTSTDNAGFRLVSGNVSSGGSVDFTTAFSANTAVTVTSLSGSAGATTLSTPQIPSHTHSVTALCNLGGPGATGVQKPSATGCSVNITYNTNATGGGGSHTHPFSFSSAEASVNLAIKYVDLIIAQRD